MIKISLKKNISVRLLSEVTNNNNDDDREEEEDCI